MERKTLLLHTCCAPCISHVHEVLSSQYDVTAYYFNPNISPVREYQKRLDELKSFASLRGFGLIEGDYPLKEWVSAVKELRYSGERSLRCWQCYRFRLEATFRKAKELKFDAVATSLSISPHKDAVMINRIGAELQGKYGIFFHSADFKKNDGYKKSVELSRRYGFYRQDYCGCVYSKIEREKNPEWLARISAFRESGKPEALSV